ncbi:MAG: beta-lactamase family protein [Candidatus Aminicenantes bacterium]|nr:MAG: beta-lactamase family protein [Candidatus Aminicenantes bacterium]
MKKITARTIVCLLVVLSFTGIIFAKSANGNAYGLLKQKLNAYFEQLEAEEYFSGSVLVAKQGKILLHKGYGLANIEEGIRNKSNTVHAIASMTKAFTSMSIMMLEERGLLSINDTVDMYIPELPVGDQITLHHLLNHTSGLFEYTYNPDVWVNMDKFHTPEEVLEYFINEPLQFEPGTSWEYCNSAYVALGIIIERVSGMSYRDFIKTNILDPLKMTHTSYDPYDMDFPYKAIGYDDISIYPPLRSPYLHPTLPYSAGAIYSTVKDLYKWDQALYTEQFVSAAALELIFTPGLHDYGYGWYIDNMDINGQPHKHIWHWGAYVGFHSYFSRLADDNVTIILLLNTSPVLGTEDELRPIVEGAAEIIFNPMA